MEKKETLPVKKIWDQNRPTDDLRVFLPQRDHHPAGQRCQVDIERERIEAALAPELQFMVAMTQKRGA